MNGNLTDWWTYPVSSEILGVGTFIQTMNNYVNGWLGYGFLLIIFLMTFGFSMVSGTKKALMTSCSDLQARAACMMPSISESSLLVKSL